MRRLAAAVLASVFVLGVVGHQLGALADGDPSAAAPPAADPATVPGYDRDPLSLLGPSRLTAPQMAAFLDGRTTHTTVPIDELARIYVEEGNALGVRADMAWAQSIVETGSFGFVGSMVNPDDNNFSGIGACDSCSRGTHYDSARLGVRAQMQLLRGYADANPPHGYSIYPPKPYRGSSPTWWQMGHGHWATSPRYASAVISTYGRMLRFAHIALAYSPPPDAALVGAAGAPVADPGPPPEPPLLAGDGVYVADVRGQVYDLGDVRFWGSLYGAPGNDDVVALATTPHGDGYWLVLADGRAVPFGTAMPVGRPGRGVVAAAAVPYGHGFWTVDGHGRVQAFGDAPKLTPARAAVPADARVVGITSTRTGSGYWLVDSLGHVYAFGDASSFGDLRDASAKDPVVGLAATPWDDGYWIATASGRVAGFGAAAAAGGLADELADNADRSVYATEALRTLYGKVAATQHLVVAIRPTPSGGGYWLVTADGLVVGRGDAPDLGPVVTGGAPVLAATSRIDTAPPFRPSPAPAP